MILTVLHVDDDDSFLHLTQKLIETLDVNNR